VLPIVYFCQVSGIKIGFDAKRYYNNHTGLGVYSRNLIRHLIGYYPELEGYLMTPKGSKLFSTPIGAQCIEPHSLLPFIWRTWGIHDTIKCLQLDIYHGLSNEIPFRRNPKTKYVCTIHDVIWRHRPNDHDFISRKIYDIKVSYACKNADLIIATSDQTKNDLMRFYQCDAQKIKVIYQTISDIPEITTPPLFPDPYFVYISAFYPRKNHESLLKAYQKSVENGNQHKLILAGRKGPTIKSIQKFIQQHHLTTKVEVLTDINEIQKFQLLKHASAFIYPSDIEGFGIPLIEAGMSRTPLILNNVPVFKEIAGEHAYYFDINNLDSLTAIMDQWNPILSKENALLLEKKMRTKLSPEKLSHELMETYLRLL
jgi:glycosyltransferase involved in cell wall biosynthesis